MRTKTTIVLCACLSACAVQTKTVMPVCYEVAVHSYRFEELNPIIGVFTKAECGQVWISADGVAKGYVNDTVKLAKLLRQVTKNIIITKCVKTRHG